MAQPFLAAWAIIYTAAANHNRPGLIVTGTGR